MLQPRCPHHAQRRKRGRSRKNQNARVDYRKTPRDFFLKAFCALSGLCHTSHTSRMWPAPVPMQVRCTTIPAGLVWSPLPTTPRAGVGSARGEERREEEEKREDKRREAKRSEAKRREEKSGPHVGPSWVILGDLQKCYKVCIFGRPRSPKITQDGPT